MQCLLKRLGPGRAREIERRDGQLEESHIGREPAGHVAGSRCRHQVVDVLACCQTGQHRNLSTAMQDLRVDALPLRHRDIVTQGLVLHCYREDAARALNREPGGRRKLVRRGVPSTGQYHG